MYVPEDCVLRYTDLSRSLKPRTPRPRTLARHMSRTLSPYTLNWCSSHSTTTITTTTTTSSSSSFSSSSPPPAGGEAGALAELYAEEDRVSRGDPRLLSTCTHAYARARIHVSKETRVHAHTNMHTNTIFPSGLCVCVCPVCLSYLFSPPQEHVRVESPYTTSRSLAAWPERGLAPSPRTLRRPGP